MKPRRNLFLGSFVAITAAICIGAGSSALAQTTYTWTQNSAATQTWTATGNWASSTVFISSATNTLQFFADTTNALANGTNNITGSVPTALTMNVLTLNGRGAAATAATNVNIASTSSTWTLGGTTPTVNLNGVNGSQALNYDVRANLTLGANTLFTGNGTASFKFSGTIGEASAGYGITKTGTSNLTLAGANNYTGAININAGTLTFATGLSFSATPPTINLGDTGGTSAAATLVWANNSLTTNNALVVRSGNAGTKSVQVNGAVAATISTLTLNDNLTKTANTGSLTVSGATTLGGATRALTVDGGTLTLSGAIGDGGSGYGLTKAGAGTLVFGTTNTYSGITTVSGGVLQVANPAYLPNYTTAGKVAINGGTLSVRLGGSDWTTGNVDSLLSAATTKTSGMLGLDTTNSGPTLTQWAAFTTTNMGGLGLAKDGTNTLILDNAGNNYTGTTAVNSGTLQVNLGATMGATTGALTMGTGVPGLTGTVGNLTLNDSFTKGAFSVISNTSDTTTPANIGLLSIASGKTLTVTSMTAGVSSSSSGNTNTALATGTANTGGTLTVNGDFATAQGSSAGTTKVDVNLSGLSNFNVTSTGGTFRAGYGGLSTGTMTLAQANTIDVGTFSVGQAVSTNNSNVAYTLNLGAGTTNIYTPTIIIGEGKHVGVVQASTASGSQVTIRGATVGTTAAITIGRSTNGTYNNLNTSGLLLAGTDASVSAGTVIVGHLNGASGGSIARGQVTFDTGTFAATSITLANATSGASTAGIQGTFTVGGPTANSAATGIVNVSGNINLAANTNGTVAGAAVGTLTINGGTVNVNTAASSTGGILDTTTNLTGGSTTTLTLEGGTLNLNGGVIGGDGTSGKLAIDTLNFRSGTLKNVAQINNGAGLTKATSGTLILEGTNAYGGVTVVSEGVLSIRSNTALGATTAGTTISTGAALEIQGTTISIGAEALSLSGTGISNGGALRNISGNNTYAGGITLSTASRINSDAGTLNLNVASGNAVTSTDLGVTFGGAGDITVSDAIALGIAGVTKDGAGILTFNAGNTYTGTTTVNGGRLVMNANQSTNGDVIINDTGTIKMSGNKTFKSGTNVAVNTGGTWLLDGTSQTVGQLTGAGTIDMAYTAVGTDTLTVGSGDVSSTFDGVIQEVAVVTSRVIALTKTGSGTLTLTGANTHGGTTSVSGGILRISNASALGDTTAGTSIIGGTATSRLELTGGKDFAAEGITLAGRSTDAVHLSNLSGNNTWNGNISTTTGGNIYSIESQADKLTIAGNISVDQSSTRFLNLSGAGDGEVSGVISGSGSNTAALTKLGLGTWTLSNANNYTGDTTVTQGTLALSASGSINNSAVIDVQSGATLSIAGVSTSTTIGGATTQTLMGTGKVDLGAKTMTIGANGTLTPGASAGTLEFIASAGGKLDFAAGSEIQFELGSSSDLFTFSSAGDWLSGSGNATLALTLLGGFDYSNTYTIFQNVTTTSFNFFDITGYDEVNYTANFAQSGTNYNLSFTPVPEPRAALLGGIGLLLLLRRRR